MIKNLDVSIKGITADSIEQRFQEHITELIKGFDFNTEVLNDVCELCTLFEQAFCG